MTAPSTNGHATKVNLDQLLAETRGEPRPVELGGQTYTLPAEFPIAVAVFLQREMIWEAVAALFGEDHVATVLPYVGITETGCPFFEAIAEQVYGIQLPPSPASARSSSSTGKRSRPTTKRTTGST